MKFQIPNLKSQTNSKLKPLKKSPLGVIASPSTVRPELSRMGERLRTGFMKQSHGIATAPLGPRNDFFRGSKFQSPNFKKSGILSLVSYFLLLTFLVFCFVAFHNTAFAKTNTHKVIKSHKHKTVGHSRVKTKAKTEVHKEEPPVQKEGPKVQISQSVIDALVKNDLNDAVIVLRDQPTSPKSLYLLREATRIVMFETSKKHPKRSDAHQFYQNLGIAYHNLFLFLKANGHDQPLFVKQALKFYKKSKGAATPMHKQEVDAVTAALLASSGEHEKADSLIKELDVTKVGLDFQTQEYLAAYYAARGETEKTIEALQTAYRERPDVILTWLAVGDDFYPIKDDPKFVSLLKDWHLARATRQLELSPPPAASPKLQYSEPAVQFRHPTAPQAQPHYKIVKHGKKKPEMIKSHSRSRKKATVTKGTQKNSKTTATKKATAKKSATAKKK